MGKAASGNAERGKGDIEREGRKTKRKGRRESE